jgi:putative DNA primase/helicase
VSALELAREYVARGWRVVPIPHRSKNPGFDGWQTLRLSVDELPSRFNGHPQNIGVLLGEPSDLVDVDLDCAEAINLAPLFLPPAPTFGRTSRRASHHLFRSRPCGATVKFYDVHPTKQNGQMLVEFRSTGGQTVFPGSVHESGEPIEWDLPGDPPELGRGDLLARVRRLAAAALLTRHGADLETAARVIADVERGEIDLPDGIELRPRIAERLRRWFDIAEPVPSQPPRSRNRPMGDVIRRASAYLAHMPEAISGQGGHQALWAAARKLIADFELDEDTAYRLLATEFNPRCRPPWSEKEMRHKIRQAGNARVKNNVDNGASTGNYTPERARDERDIAAPPPDWQSSFTTHLAAQERGEEAHVEQAERDAIMFEEPAYFATTDYGNAERLVACHGRDLRYCQARRRWYVWDGTRWALDETGHIHLLAKRTVRSIYGEAERCNSDRQRRALAKHARDSEKASKIAAMIQLAQSEPGVPVQVHDLDSDPMLFNVKNGTIDLRTGELRPHMREDLITKLAPVVYQPDAIHELWVRFLASVTGGDIEYAAYIRRCAGYAMTGQVSEKTLFFAHGPSNGAKSSLIDGLSATFGDYHATADFDTWCTRTNPGGNRGDLVRLAGARLVTSVEVAAGKRFDESLLKRVTGGDELTAAAKFEAEITFRPTFKILLAANDAPKVRHDDDPLWKRLKLLPFTHVVERPDPTVKARLRDTVELGPAILAWAVRGCLEWQRDGLGEASAVVAASKEYREQMDPLREFFDQHCVFADDAKVTRRALRGAYEEFARENGVRAPLGAKQFAALVRARGCQDTSIRVEGEPRDAWAGVRLCLPHEDVSSLQGGA